MTARRRAEDAAMLLPLAGAALVLLPLVWRGASTGAIMLWLLLVWLALIGAVAALGRRLTRE